MALLAVKPALHDARPRAHHRRAYTFALRFRTESAVAFLQDAPQLAHPYRSDRVLCALLERVVPAARMAALDADLDALGDYAQMAWQRANAGTRRKPVLTQWDAWGQRVDRIELTTAWMEGPTLTTRHGILAAGQADHDGARLEQFARVYLYHVASEFYTCPLAMTDGAIAALKASGNQALIDRALPHFLSRDASSFWLSGQWMTENAGGSDVGNTKPSRGRTPMASGVFTAASGSARPWWAKQRWRWRGRKVPVAVRQRWRFSTSKRSIPAPPRTVTGAAPSW
jgi:hypothetical protein